MRAFWWRGPSDGDSGAGADAEAVFAPSVDGEYFVSAGAGGSGTGSYVLSAVDVTDGFPDDFSGDVSAAGTVAVGGSVQGEAQFEGDRDWFAVSLEAGETYVVWLRGRDSRSGTSWDPHVYGITDDAGVPVEATISGDGGLGTDATALFAASAAGTYFVSAGAAAGERGTYTLSVERWVGVGEASGEDFAAGASSAGPVGRGHHGVVASGSVE